MRGLLADLAVVREAVQEQAVERALVPRAAAAARLLRRQRARPLRQIFKIHSITFILCMSIE